MKEPIASRIERLTSVDHNGCWNWLGNKSPKGYGESSVGGHRRRAHRLAYEAFVGNIPPGLWVLHRCDNPACCNPKHLYLGDHERNTRDKVERARQARFPGELHPMVKLDESAVRHIRGTSGARVPLAKKYGVSTRTISDIRSRRSWKHLP